MPLNHHANPTALNLFGYIMPHNKSNVRWSANLFRSHVSGVVLRPRKENVAKHFRLTLLCHTLVFIIDKLRRCHSQIRRIRLKSNRRLAIPLISLVGVWFLGFSSFACIHPLSMGNGTTWRKTFSGYSSSASTAERQYYVRCSQTYLYRSLTCLLNYSSYEKHSIPARIRAE